MILVGGAGEGQPWEESSLLRSPYTKYKSIAKTDLSWATFGELEWGQNITERLAQAWPLILFGQQPVT